MFPYLRSKDDFLCDCEHIRFKIDKSTGDYRLVEHPVPQHGYFGAIRGCDHESRRCKGCDEKTRCARIPATSPFWRGCTENDDIPPCENVSEIVAWLTENVNKADWHSRATVGIGSIEFGRIQSWCQSLGIFMHDVVRRLPGGNLVIGLEHFAENTISARTGSPHYILDMIIAGYGIDGRKKVIIIELKQNDNSRYSTADRDDAVDQVKAYRDSILGSLDNMSDLDIIPCVYFHNYSGDASLDMWCGDVYVCFGGTTVQPDLSCGMDRMSEFICDNIDSCYPGEPAKSIIKEMKQKTRKLSVDDLASIMYGGRYDKHVLRPDQKNAFERIVGSNPQKINIIQGATGCGKTVVMSLLVRHFVEQGMKVMLLYHGSAPINAIIKNGVSNIVKQELISALAGNTDEDMRVYFDYILLCFTRLKNDIDEISDNLIQNWDWDNPFEISEARMDRYKNDPNEYRTDVRSFIATYWHLLPDAVRDWLTNVRVISASRLLETGYGSWFSDNDETVIPDVLIFDEFHRFQDKTDSTTGVTLRGVFENALDQTPLNVLMIDVFQSIDQKDIGVNIVHDLQSRPDVHIFDLWSQFRCNNSEGFVTWIEQVLQMSSDLNPTYVDRIDMSASKTFLEDLDYDAHILEENDPEIFGCLRNERVVFLTDKYDDLKELLGPCIHYSKGRSNKNGFTDPRRVEDDGSLSVEIGTCSRVQGVEYDEAFVLIGKELDYIDGRVCFTEDYVEQLWNSTQIIPDDIRDEINTRYPSIPDKRNRMWTYLVNRCGIDKCEIYSNFFEKFIDRELTLAKNRYRILLTRGLNRCYIYVANENLRNHFKTYEKRHLF